MSRIPIPPQNTTDPKAPLLRAEGIKKDYGGRQILKGMNLSVGNAEVISIIGPNGSGKSTFLRCLNLLETYQEGRVFLRGQVMSEGRPRDHQFTGAEKEQARNLRLRVGMVFQKFNLFPHLTVLRNVMCGPRHSLGVSEEQAYDIAREVLTRVGLWEKHPCDPGTLSGGQQQRVAIARALAMHPDVLLSDEATSALDPVMTKEVLRVFRTLATEGMTMIIVTHDLDFARDISDRVVYMEDGLVAASDSPEVIFDQRPCPGLKRFLQKE